MNSFKKHLKLIQVVHNNYSHIQDLETLSDMFKDMKESDYSKSYPNEYQLNQSQIDELNIICKTTQNTHYNYGLFTDKIYQDPNNHIDNVIKSNN